MNPPPLPPPPPSPSPSATSFHPFHHPNPLPSLPTALATLASLLDFSTTTLHSLSDIDTGTTALLPCPFNPTHHIPPSSLFSHYLRCPSPLSISHALRYPHTLDVPHSAISFPDSSSDLCFSLENYFDTSNSANSFFYQNCPCPVFLFNNDRSIPPPPSLTLPRFLYLECSNFNNVESATEEIGCSGNSIRLLPSEIWANQNEIEGWGAGEFPTSYSFRIIRAILRLQDCLLLRLRDWIVVNSHRYGVIVDLSMRDHILWLVKLCLKAIIKEAFVLAGFLLRDEDLKMESGVAPGLNDRRFECPVLFNVLTWLALQFGILYGEVNGKFVALAVLKECILESSLNASLFYLEGRDVESSDLDRIDGEVKQHQESSVYNRKRNETECTEGHTVGNSVIFISQVAAAVAALHERSMVEGHIRAARESRPLSAYQRNLEHAYVAKIADDERQKRSDYRPVIEHDGLLWQRSNMDTKKVKTREELLAEERDYKRRRMSYRGKKLKRNATMVMRDIIDEYMEEIKQAGGIDSISNTVEEVEASASENSFRHEIATDVSQSRRQYQEKTEESVEQSRDISNELESRYDSDYFMDGVQLHRRDSSWHNELRDSNRNAERVGLDRDDNSRRLDGRQNSSHSREQMHYRDKVDYIEVFGEDSSTRSNQSRMLHGRNSHKRERDEGEQNSHKKKRDEIWEFRDRGKHKNIRDHRDREEDIDGHRDRARSKTIRDSKDREENVDRHGGRGRSKTNMDLRDRDENGGGLRNRWRSKIDRKNSSASGIHNEFADRYDPAKPSDIFDDDV